MASCLESSKDEMQNIAKSQVEHWGEINTLVGSVVTSSRDSESLLNESIQGLAEAIKEFIAEFGSSAPKSSFPDISGFGKASGTATFYIERTRCSVDAMLFDGIGKLIWKSRGCWNGKLVQNRMQVMGEQDADATLSYDYKPHGTVFSECNPIFMLYMFLMPEMDVSGDTALTLSDLAQQQNWETYLSRIKRSERNKLVGNYDCTALTSEWNDHIKITTYFSNENKFYPVGFDFIDSELFFLKKFRVVTLSRINNGTDFFYPKKSTLEVFFGYNKEGGGFRDDCDYRSEFEIVEIQKNIPISESEIGEIDPASVRMIHDKSTDQWISVSE